MHICHTKVDFIPSDPSGDENGRTFGDLNCMVFHYDQCKAKFVSLSMSKSSESSTRLMCLAIFQNLREKFIP